MDLTQVEEVLQSEKKAFQDDRKHAYVSLTKELSLSPKIDECVVFVGTAPPKRYVEASLKGLASHRAVLIVGKGSDLAKAVTVAEQVKQQTQGRIVQLNQAALHASLINPAHKPAASRKNVSVFFDDSPVSTTPHESESDALRAIRGHKVYQTPSMSIMLLSGDGPHKVKGWTVQAEE